MKTHLLYTALLLLFIHTSYATTWQVGASRTYTKPSQVSTLVQNGDTVLIDAGIYESDVARWSANDLVLKGSGGKAHLKSNGANFGGKAIWVIAGNNTRVENIEFSLCTVQDQNGAGIRQEGVGLTVSHCYFHNNDEGILAGDNATSDILIKYSEFADNGFGDGYSHNLYINHVRSLTFTYNYTHGAKVGHELKSRAYNNYILYNRITDGATGTASYSIDLPNGGPAYIIGNEIQQGPLSGNSTIITYGEEGLTNPATHNLYVINNTIVNDRGSGVFVKVQTGAALYKAYNNIFAGTGTAYAGVPTSEDTTHNFYTSVAKAGLTDAASFDYSLLPGSPAVNGGASPGAVGNFSLAPQFEYVQPTGSMARNVVGTIDIGAHEFGEVATGIDGTWDMGQVKVYPNPATDLLNVFAPAQAHGIKLVDMSGRLVLAQAMEGWYTQIDVQQLPAGVYLLYVESAATANVKRIMIY